MAFGTATLTGTYKTFDDQPAEGVVEIIPNSRQLVDAEGNRILAGRVKVTLDATGSFSVTLPATDDATVEPATGRQYTVVAKLRHTHLAAVTGIELATGATVDVADVASAAEVDATATRWYEKDATISGAWDFTSAPTVNGSPIGTGGGGGAVDSVNGKTGAVSLTAADVGAETPAGAQAKATAAENAAKAASTPVAHATATNNPHAVTKAQVGLGSVDNTADLDKPISTATAAALATKADTASVPTTAADVGADPAGSAAAAQTAAQGYTDTQIAGEVTRADAAYATPAQLAAKQDAAALDADTAALVPDTGTATGAALSATYARRRGYVADVVKDHGAKVDGSTDDTAAWQAALNDVAANGGGTIVSSRQGVSIIAGPLQDTAGANAQLVLPAIHYVNDKQITVTIEGSTPPPVTFSVVGTTPLPDGHLVLKSTLATGTGAVIGGYEGTGTTGFTNVLYQMRNATVRLPANPTLTGLDLRNAACIDLDNVVVDSGNYYVEGPQPTTSTSFGIRVPKVGNGAYTRLGAVNVIGFYNGYEFAEHSVGQQVAAWGCQRAFTFTGASHASKFQRLQAVHCAHGITFTGDHYVDIDQYNVEHATSGWMTAVADVDDAYNWGCGTVNWHVVKAGVGIDSTFTVNGGVNMRIMRTGGVAAVRAYNNTPFTATLNAHTVVPLGSESFDTDGFHDTSTNPSRVTIPWSGWYRIDAGAGFTGNNGVGLRMAVIWQNGVGTGNRLAQVEMPAVANESTNISLSAGVRLLSAGDYIELGVYVDAGSVFVSGGQPPSDGTWLTVEKVG